MTVTRSYEITGSGAKSFNLEFARTHYNIYPWIAEGLALCRVLRLTPSGVPSLARVKRSSRGLQVQLLGARSLRDNEVERLRHVLTFCLGLDADYTRLEAVAKDDPVLSAALQINAGIRPKRYSDIFEAVCGAICAQNVDFRRLYQMMELLAKRFGPSIEVDGQIYSGFPLAAEVAGRSVDELRECKVGYRADRILKAARWFTASPSATETTASTLRTIDRNSAMERVCQVPGIGPYSAAIVLGAGAGRQDIFHLDSFTRHILREFYFEGRSTSDDELREFVDSRWPGFGGSVAHVLTTNTETWAERLGREGFRRSGARQ